jgi:hypothetical protein
MAKEIVKWVSAFQVGDRVRNTFEYFKTPMYPAQGDCGTVRGWVGNNFLVKWDTCKNYRYEGWSLNILELAEITNNRQALRFIKQDGIRQEEREEWDRLPF